MAATVTRVHDPLSPGALADVRRWAGSWVTEHATDAVDAANVCLVLTELVTNSIRHGRGPVTVEMAWHPPMLMIGVTDLSDDLPRPPAAVEDAESGRGIAVLEALVTRWGVRLADQGKTVWCEFVSVAQGIA